MLEDVARAAHQQRERTVREHALLHQQLRDPMGHHGGAGGGLAHDGHAGQDRHRRLLREAPGGEVEGVDVHGHAAAGHRDVLAVEARRAAQRDALAVHHEARLAQGLADLRVGREREGRAVHVELGVAPGVSAILDREVQDLLAVGLDHVGQDLEQRAALGEGQRAQRRAALGAGVLQGRGHVDPARARAGQRLLGGGVDQGLEVALPLHPLPADVAAQREHARRYWVSPSWVSTKA